MLPNSSRISDNKYWLKTVGEKIDNPINADRTDINWGLLVFIYRDLLDNSVYGQATVHHKKN